MRNIFRVDAWVIDSTGAYHPYAEGYPKNFDSNSYGGDVDKAKKRAEGDMSDIWGAMCKNDTRQIQTVTLCDIHGFRLAEKTTGDFPAEPAE